MNASTEQRASLNSGLSILIVGGYGTFGGRLVQLLQDEPRLRLIVAGRSLARSTAYCAKQSGARAALAPAVFDRDGELDHQLDDLRPDVVVDASGPFQVYGANPYRLVRACISRRISYLDLADGSDFVAGITTHDEEAVAAGIFALSGVSSFPVLTAAVVRYLTTDLAEVHSIRGGIAPSPYAGVGVNVIRAIASYAGQPVALRRDGKTVTARPFTESLRYVIAPPGKMPLRPLRFSLVDVPDLKMLVELWPGAQTVWMGAGPVPASLHRALRALAWLVRFGVLKSLLRLAPLMAWTTNHLRWGEHRGGMFVEVTGQAATGTPIQRSWHLLAEGDDGPLIPSMAAEAIIRKILDGDPPAHGARAAVRDLELTHYDKLFEGRQLYTGTRQDGTSKAAPLYARILGQAWQALPAEIKSLHSVQSTATFAGRCTVERGRAGIGRLVARAFGFPQQGQDVDVTVRFDVQDGVEIWTRTFNGRSFSSIQYEGSGESEYLLCERFGPLCFAMALVIRDARLHLILRRWSAFGIPLPRWLGPNSRAHESVADGRFCFNVEIGHAITGLIVRYRGWLVAAPSHTPLSSS